MKTFSFQFFYLHLLLNDGNEHIAMVIIILQLKNSENIFFQCLNWFGPSRSFSRGLGLSEMSLFVVGAYVYMYIYSVSCLLCVLTNIIAHMNIISMYTHENFRPVCVYV